MIFNILINILSINMLTSINELNSELDYAFIQELNDRIM